MEHGLVPLESVRIVAQIVPKDMFLNLVDERSLHRAKDRMASAENNIRELDQFYASSFFRPKYEEFSI